MVGFAEQLRPLPAQLLEHTYHYDAFGSWWTRVRYRGKVFRVVFDGCDGRLCLERATAAGAPDDWEQLGPPVPSDGGGGAGLHDIVGRLKAV